MKFRKIFLGEVEKIVENRFEFAIKDHWLTFHGICKRCQSDTGK